WPGFCRAAGHPEWTADPRFAANGDRVANRAALMALIERAFAERTTREWLERLHADGVPAAPIQTLDRVLGDPQIHHRGMVVDDADVVIAPLPASTHEDIGRRLAGVVTERQIVLLGAATLGSFVIAREIARAGKPMPLALAETGTLPYLARKTGPAAVAAPVRAADLPVGVFPASRGKEALARVRELYAATRPCVDAIDVALTNVR